MTADSPALRPATARDHTTIFEIYAETRAPELEQTGWSHPQRDAFVRGQFEARRRSYEREFPAATTWIITLRDKPIGSLIVERTGREIRIVDMALFAAYRGAGHGRQLIAGLQAEAARTRVPLRLSVRNSNPARRLYERLGFNPTSLAGDYLRMEWTPPTAVEAPDAEPSSG